MVNRTSGNWQPLTFYILEQDVYFRNFENAFIWKTGNKFPLYLWLIKSRFSFQ
jgi:hypothetical protein